MAGKSQFSSDMSDLLVPLTGLLLGIGNVWFVDSGNSDAVDSSGAGRTLAQPFNSLRFAVGQTTPSNGDLVMVAPGHTESITSADGILFATAAVGVTVIGIGNGLDRPTFTWTTAVTADMEIDAVSVTLHNLYFDMTGVDNVTAAIDVNASNFKMIGCEVLMADSGGQAAIAIELDGNANNCKFLHCEFSAVNVGGASAIKINGTLASLEIGNCWIDGDFSDACIHNPTGNVATQLYIHDCMLKNDQTTDHALELVSACTGSLVRNMYHTDSDPATTITVVDPGACRSFECYACDLSDKSGIIEPEAT